MSERPHKLHHEKFILYVSNITLVYEHLHHRYSNKINQCSKKKKHNLCDNAVFFKIKIKQFSTEIAKPLTTKNPNSRRDSKKWKVDRSNEKNTAGIKDEAMLREDEDEDEEDFNNSKSSAFGFQRIGHGYLDVLAVFVMTLLALMPKLTT